MPLQPGTRLGPYEITGTVGAGGMGEVYRARDTRLGRDVAIKVLPESFARDAILKERFEREARIISSLNHPNICTLHDVGHQDGTDYLVMELLEGESLAERVARGPLPIAEMLRAGMEISDALEQAHRQGIVHRDLKPGNVVLTKSGAKLLDFGLAKPNAPVTGPGSSLSAIATKVAPASPVTREGTVVGTFQYMSPEQVEGREADARSDIFALGAVLYEMATGKRPFEGKSQISVASAILEKDPEPISRVQPMTPPALEHVVTTCLAKDPEERFQRAHDVRLQLKWIAEGGSQAGAAPRAVPRGKSRERVGWIIAAVLFVGLAFATAGYLMRSPAPRRPVRVSLLAPADTSFHPFDIALSPDGTRLAFVASGTGTRPRLWVRPLDSLTGQPLAGTEGAIEPFWSPDGRQIGFFADGKMKRIDASGGAVQVVADAGEPRGGAWGADGTIIFTPSTADPLYKVSVSGGPVAPLTALDRAAGDSTHRWPFFLPDGRHFLFLNRTAATTGKGPEEGGNGIYLSSLDAPGSKQLLVPSQRRALYASGAVLFVSGGNLVAQKIDLGRGATVGDQTLVAEQIAFDERYSAAFSVSGDGKLVFQGGGAQGNELVWYDRDGRKDKVVAREMFSVVRLSPDNTKVAGTIVDGALGTLDIWIFDLARGVKTRFTFDPGTDDDPVWSPDGNSIVFDASRNGAYNIYRKSSNGGRPEELIFEDKVTKWPTSWSSDGRHVLIDRTDPQSQNHCDIWVLPMFGDKKPFPLVASPFNEQLGEFSPDGKWVAYVSNESGRDEVYLITFPTPGGRFQVSVNGGSSPKWRRDGKELYYLDAVNKLIAVPINEHGESVEIGAPHPLFDTRIVSRGYMLSPTADGKRFLMVEPPEVSTSSLTMVLDWDTALGK
jgi:Tol biopolymer transport system component